MIYEVHSISFQTFFVWTFKIVIDSWKFSILLLYILWDDWPIFMISASNEQLQQQLEYTLLLKPDCHSWWISKMQSGREDTLEERYAIKFCFKLGNNATEMYGMLKTAFGASCINQASVFEWYKRCLWSWEEKCSLLYWEEWVDFRKFDVLNGMETRNKKCSNICVGSGESQTYTVYVDRKEEVSVLKRWKVSMVVILGSCGFHQKAAVRSFRWVGVILNVVGITVDVLVLLFFFVWTLK